MYDYIGTMPVEIELKKFTEQKIQYLTDKIANLVDEKAIIKSSILQIENELAYLPKEFEGDIKELYIEICSQLQIYKELPITIKSIENQNIQVEKQIDNQLSQLISILNQWEDLKEIPSTLAERLKVITDAHFNLSIKYESIDLELLLKELSNKKTEIQKLYNQIVEIDAKLALVEREVINKASIIGATLTKTYLSDDIQARKFDTVILDEASMAAIPAVWSAAILAQNNLIIVGDFKQLPPIVLSKNELTKKWLVEIFSKLPRLRKNMKKIHPVYLNILYSLSSNVECFRKLHKLRICFMMNH
jgi:superfamily I DNA and/or RNA helicase